MISSPSSTIYVGMSDFKFLTRFHGHPSSRLRDSTSSGKKRRSPFEDFSSVVYEINVARYKTWRGPSFSRDLVESVKSRVPSGVSLDESFLQGKINTIISKLNARPPNSAITYGMLVDHLVREVTNKAQGDVEDSFWSQSNFETKLRSDVLDRLPFWVSFFGGNLLTFAPIAYSSRLSCELLPELNPTYDEVVDQLVIRAMIESHQFMQNRAFVENKFWEDADFEVVMMTKVRENLPASVWLTVLDQEFIMFEIRQKSFEYSQLSNTYTGVYLTEEEVAKELVRKLLRFKSLVENQQFQRSGRAVVISLPGIVASSFEQVAAKGDGSLFSQTLEVDPETISEPEFTTSVASYTDPCLDHLNPTSVKVSLFFFMSLFSLYFENSLKFNQKSI